jgi:hypothetical protein
MRNRIKTWVDESLSFPWPPIFTVEFIYLFIYLQFYLTTLSVAQTIRYSVKIKDDKWVMNLTE